MALEYYDYLKFIDDALELTKKIPKYFSRYSDKIWFSIEKQKMCNSESRINKQSNCP